MVLYHVLVLVGRPLARIAFRPTVRGLEHVPRGGVVVCPNHLSGFDVIAVGYALGTRPAHHMAKNQLFLRPILGPFVRALGAFPARAGDGLAGGVGEAAALAAAGHVVVIFPEGARRRGRVRRPRGGAARAALTAGVPLVPVALRGTDDWRRFRPWTIAFGPPVDLDDLAEQDITEATREATRRLWERIVGLEAPLDGGAR